MPVKNDNHCSFQAGDQLLHIYLNRKHDPGIGPMPGVDLPDLWSDRHQVQRCKCGQTLFSSVSSPELSLPCPLPAGSCCVPWWIWWHYVVTPQQDIPVCLAWCALLPAGDTLGSTNHSIFKLCVWKGCKSMHMLSLVNLQIYPFFLHFGLPH